MSEQSSALLSWDQDIVELEALERAAYELAAELTAQIDLADGRFTVTLRPRGPKGDIEDLSDRFREEVVDQALRLKIATRAQPVRDLVFALAFSQTGLIDATEES